MNFSLKSQNVSVGIPSSVHGGSPTTYFAASMLSKQMMEQSKEQVNYCTPSKFSQHPVYNPLPSNSSSSYSNLHVAAVLGQTLSAQTLFDTPSEVPNVNQLDHNGNTALMWASAEGNYDFVQLLIDNGADLNLQNFNGETALSLATARGFTNICSLLLEGGANPNLGNLDEVTPLHLAVANGHLETIRLLVKMGAFVNARDAEGDSPLHYAVREGQFEVLRCLVSECKACVDVQNEDLETPLELASCLNETAMVQFLAPLSSDREIKGHEVDSMLF